MLFCAFLCSFLCFLCSFYAFLCFFVLFFMLFLSLLFQQDNQISLLLLSIWIVKVACERRHDKVIEKDNCLF